MKEWTFDELLTLSYRQKCISSTIGIAEHIFEVRRIFLHFLEELVCILIPFIFPSKSIGNF
jgi:hypothetical protein